MGVERRYARNGSIEYRPTFDKLDAVLNCPQKRRIRMVFESGVIFVLDAGEKAF